MDEREILYIPTPCTVMWSQEVILVRYPHRVVWSLNEWQRREDCPKKKKPQSDRHQKIRSTETEGRKARAVGARR